MVLIDFLKKNKYLVIASVVSVGLLIFAFVSGGKLEDTTQAISTADTAIFTKESINYEDISFAYSKTESDFEPYSNVAETEDNSKKQSGLSIKTDTDNNTKQNSDSKSDNCTQKTEKSNTVNHTKQNSVSKSDKDTKKSESTTIQSKIDKYKTTPVPEGKPEPVEPQEQEIDEDTTLKCTFSISCETILNNLDTLDKNKLELVPEDAWILKPTVVEFNVGESVFDVLVRICKENKIHMEYSWTPIYNSAYIEGIGNLYEFDCGSLSGWMYRVNKWFPNYGCSRYELKNGDTVEWKYTCDLGYDVGGGYVTGE